MKKTLSVDQLLLDVKNPRLDSDESQIVTQADALSAILADDVEDALTIAKDIVAYGLIEAQLILVYFDGRNYIVKDGNRRISALKLIKHPDFISDPELREKFVALHEKISADNKTDFYEKIDCSVMTDELEADKQVKKIHTGKQDGSGQKTWNAQQVARFEFAHDPNKTSLWLSFCDAVKQREDITDQYKRGLAHVAKTNAERALSDKNISRVLGVERQGKVISIPKLTNELLIFLAKLINKDGLHVDEIYNAEKRKVFAQKLKEEAASISGIPSVTLPDPKPSLIDSQKVEAIPIPAITTVEEIETQQTNAKTGNKTKSRKSNTVKTATDEPTKSIPKRTTLIGKKQFIDESEHERINDIFRELKTLNIDKYPNCGAVMLRVLIEFGTNDFIKKHESDFHFESKERTKEGEPTLRAKIKKICKYLVDNGIVDRAGVKRANTMTEDDFRTSVHSFNSYVHNVNFTPIPNEIKTTWDDLWLFIDAIFKQESNDND